MKILDDEGLAYVIAKLKGLFATKDSPTMTGTATVDGNKVYHTGNITISTLPPTEAMPEGHIHQVY